MGKKIVQEHPGPEVRETDVEERTKQGEGHRFSTESPRWGGQGSSQQERGYPRESSPPPPGKAENP